MKQVGWMAAGSVGSWLIATWIAGRGTEMFFGMLGPLLAACVTWLAVARAHRVDPAKVAPTLMAGFAVKILFFGAYVVLVMRLGQVEVTPFATAFAGYFVALYAVQAVLVHRLAAPQAS